MLKKKKPFLDVEIKITDTRIETQIYSKPTHAKLLLNFHALCPIKYGNQVS